MNGDLEFIETVCTNCGYEAKQEVGWLKAQASDLRCVKCGSSVQYKAENIEFILRKKAAMRQKAV